VRQAGHHGVRFASCLADFICHHFLVLAQVVHFLPSLRSFAHLDGGRDVR
jgi:hypothetical protein